MFDCLNTKYEDAEVVIKNKDTALKALQLLKKRKRTAEVYCYLSKSYIYLKDLNKALLYAKKAILVEKDNSYAHYIKGWAFLKLMNYREAEKNLLKSESLGYLSDDLFYNLAHLFYSVNDFKSSLTNINKAIMLDKTSHYNYSLKGSILSSMGKNDEAKKCYMIALKLQNKK